MICAYAIVFGFFVQFLLSAWSSLFFCYNFAVHRRIGGLEMQEIKKEVEGEVHRRIGGLEIKSWC